MLKFNEKLVAKFVKKYAAYYNRKHDLVSTDGNEWRNRTSNRLANSPEFHSSTITLVGGDSDGLVVA